MPNLKPFGTNSEPIPIQNSKYKDSKEFVEYKLKQILEDFRNE